MSLSAMIRSQVRRAFDMVGDIAFDATLQSRNVGPFDFSSQSTVTAASSSKVVRAVRVTEGSGSQQGVSGTLLMVISFSAEGVPVPDIYDTVVIGGTTWSVVPPYESDGYLITLNLKREA